MTKALIIIAIAELIGVTVTIFNTVMWLYFNKKEDKRRDAQDRVVALLQKEKPNQLFSNECARCIYTDSLCVPSDYGKDKDNCCDHFKGVFEENEELRARVEKQNADILTLKDLSERQRLQIEALDEEIQIPWKDIKDKSEVIKENTELKEQNNKAKDLLIGFVSKMKSSVYTPYEKDLVERAEQFLKESEK